MRILLLILFLIVSFGQAQEEFQALAGPYLVASIIDAQTLELSNGETMTQVELLGILTPSTNKPPCALYQTKALDFTSGLLQKEVWLEFDMAEHEDTQTLYAYVYLADDKGNWVYEPKHFVQINEQLLLQGLAEPYFADAAMRYEDKYLLATIEARKQGLGIWSSAEAPLDCTSN